MALFITSLKRVGTSGYFMFRRNGWLSAATVMVLTLVLFALGNLVFLGALAQTVLGQLESKIDISAYFTADAPEEQILSVKHDIEKTAEVARVEYISKDMALEQFRERHRGNTLIATALEEIGANPLQASLNIKAKNPSQYAQISEFLVKKNYPIVEKINYFENREVIERLSSILGTIRGWGAIVAVLLAFIAVLVAFNTIRLAIYTLREEIGIMRLVGGTAWFIRGPFIVSGVLYGTAAAVATTSMFFPLAWLVSPKILMLVPSFNLFQYFLSNFWQFFSILFAAGIALGTLSSSIAIRRYLKI